MTEGAALAADAEGEPSLRLPSADESHSPVSYVLTVDEDLWKISEHLISRKHPSVNYLANLQKGLAALAKFMKQMMYPRKADAELSKLKIAFGSNCDTLLDKLGQTLSSLSDYIETLDALGETGTVTARSPTDLGASVTVKGEKRDAFIGHFNELQLKFQVAVKPLSPESNYAD